MIYLLLILPILFESLSDGLYLRGLKVWSKQIKVLMILSWILVWWLVPFTWQGVLIYFLLRAILYNYVHNLAAWSAIKLKLEIDRNDLLFYTEYEGRPVSDKPYNEAKWYEILFYIGTVPITDRILALLSFGQWYLILLFQIICAIALYFLI